MGWKPVSFGEEENEIYLQSTKCHKILLSTDCPPCVACRMLEYSSQFLEFMGRATDAKSHTPWDLLSHQQLHALLHKMAETIKTLRKKVREF